MSNRNAAAELLHILAAVMQELDLRWYVFGAQAVILWGAPRLTVDVDVTVKIQPAAVGLLIETMRRHGVDPVFSDREFIERSRVIPFVYRRTGMRLDVVLAGPGFEEEFLERSIAVDIEGTAIPVISPEDLVITKILAARPKDIDDARSVIYQHKATLDVERIRNILGLLEQALAQSDLLPVFENALRE